MAKDPVLKLVGDWKALRLFFLDAKQRGRFYQEYDRRIGLRAVALRDLYKERIKDKRYAANAPLTARIKGSKTPLVDHAMPGLRSNLTASRVEPGTWFTGIKRTARHGEADDFVNVAEALHEGFTFTWTAEVRAAVFAKFRERSARRYEAYQRAYRRDPGSVSGLVEGTTIYVEGRPFIREPWEEVEGGLRAGLAKDFEASLLAAYKASGARGRRR